MRPRGLVRIGVFNLPSSIQGKNTKSLKSLNFKIKVVVGPFLLDSVSGEVEPFWREATGVFINEAQIHGGGAKKR